MAGFSYDRYDRRPAPRSRSVLGYWIPVLVTTTLAAGALGAWVLRAREDNESTTSDDDDDLSYGGDTDREKENYRPPSYGVSEGVTGQGSAATSTEDSTLLGRVQSTVQSTIRRTPSPQQIFDGASRKVVAGVAAAGAAVGGALTAIRENPDDDYADHERWRDQNTPTAAKRSGGNSVPRRTVAVVVSAEDGDVPYEEDEDRGWKSEHASLLSHIPRVNPATTNLIILIYAPRHQPHASTSGQAPGRGAPSSLASSYSAINTPAHTPGDELSSIDPMPITPALSARSSGSSFYDLIYKQASRLVDQPTAIMPFSTPTGFVHMLKHISPDVVYVSDSLSGDRGKNMEDIKGWVGQIVVVVGGEGAGLVDDTDREDDGDRAKDWWQTSQSVGLGKGIEVVEAVRVSDDWARRVGGRD